MTSLIEVFGLDAVMAAIENAGFADIDALLVDKATGFAIGDILADMLSFGGAPDVTLPTGGLSDQSALFDGFNWKTGGIEEGYRDSGTHERIEFDTEGKVRKTTWTYKNGEKHVEHQRYDSNGKPAGTTTNAYDKDGKMIANWHADKDGNTKSGHDYTYDSEGRVVRSEETKAGLKTGNYREFEYDENGNKTKIKTFKDNKLVNTREIERGTDENGNTVTKTVKDTDADGNTKYVVDNRTQEEKDFDNAWEIKKQNEQIEKERLEDDSPKDPDSGFATGTGDGLKDPEEPEPGAPDPETTQPDSPFGPDGGEGKGELPNHIGDPTHGRILVDPEKDMLIFVEVPEHLLDPTYGLVDPDGPQNPEGGGATVGSPQIGGVQQYFVIEVDGDVSIQEGIMIDTDQVLFL